MPEDTKRGRGRPSKGPVRRIKLPQELWDWLKAQPKDYSDTIKDLIDQAMHA